MIIRTYIRRITCFCFFSVNLIVYWPLSQDHQLLYATAPHFAVCFGSRHKINFKRLLQKSKSRDSRLALPFPPQAISLLSRDLNDSAPLGSSLPKSHPDGPDDFQYDNKMASRWAGFTKSMVQCMPPDDAGFSRALQAPCQLCVRGPEAGEHRGCIPYYCLDP